MDQEVEEIIEAVNRNTELLIELAELVRRMTTNLSFEDKARVIIDDLKENFLIR